MVRIQTREFFSIKIVGSKVVFLTTIKKGIGSSKKKIRWKIFCRIKEKVIYYWNDYDTDIMNFHAGETIIRCEGPERKLVLPNYL